MKFLLVVINTISVEIFGAKPDLNIVYFPITLMLDMPLILILTVSLIYYSLFPTEISRKKQIKFFSKGKNCHKFAF